MTETLPLSPSTGVAVIGAGTMGAGIAQVAAQAGHAVLLYDNRAGAARDAIETLRAQLTKRVERGRIKPGDAERIIAMLTPCETLDDLFEAHLVIEAIVEDIAIKQQVFRKLEQLCDADAIFATNTSSLSVTAIASQLNDPGRLAGMHFFNPAPVMKLCEIVAGLESRPAVVETLLATAQAWGKVAVRVSNTPGFIVNRVARPFYTEAMKVFEEGGAGIATLDELLHKSGGFAMGPFTLTDLIGQDINLAVSRSVFASYYQDRRFEPSLVQQALVEAGLLGRKTGRGFYDYRDGAAAPAVEDIPPGQTPNWIRLDGEPGLWQPLADRLSDSGIDWQRGDPGQPAALVCDGVTLRLTEGRTASFEAARYQEPNTVLFDLAHDFATTERLGLDVADQAEPDTLNRAAALLQHIGIRASRVEDSPGLIVMRTVVMLCNLAADAVHKGVCSAEDTDRAMRAGTNYPEGPLAWGRRIGYDRVVDILDKLEDHYRDGRYRPSPWLRRRVLMPIDAL